MDLRERVLTILSCFTTITIDDLQKELDMSLNDITPTINILVKERLITYQFIQDTNQVVISLYNKDQEQRENQSENQDTNPDHPSLFESMMNDIINELDKNDNSIDQGKFFLHPMGFGYQRKIIFPNQHDSDLIHPLKIHPKNPDLIITDRGLISIESLKKLLKTKK